MLKIAICDDDKSIVEQLCSLLEEYRSTHYSELQFTPFSSAFGFLSAVECGQHFDIAILDVLMPNINGIQAAQEIRHRDESMELLFLSSSREYAVDSYSVQARNYLLKPLTRDTFFKAMDQTISSMSPGTQHSFWVKDKNGGISRIFPSRLLYCEVIRKDMVFHLTDGHTIHCRKSLIELMKDLGEEDTFYHPHRSYLVNMDHVQRVTKTELILTGGIPIPLARGKYQQAMEAFINHSFHALLTQEVRHDEFD